MFSYQKTAQIFLVCRAPLLFRHLLRIYRCLNVDVQSLVKYGVKSLFGLLFLYAQLYSLTETPQLPPSPRFWAHYIRGSRLTTPLAYSSPKNDNY